MIKIKIFRVYLERAHPAILNTIVVLVRFKLINLKKKQNVYFGTYTRNGQFRKIIKENVW